jgi:DNA-binding transcriptional ArsR family regulator
MDGLFTVLADPTRRQIIAMLAERERSAGELVAAFDISQPAISRHLRILREAGLVTVREEGQRRIYRLDAAPLAALDDWLMGYRRFWSTRLDRLEQRIEERRREALAQATEEE